MTEFERCDSFFSSKMSNFLSESPGAPEAQHQGSAGSICRLSTPCAPEMADAIASAFVAKMMGTDAGHVLKDIGTNAVPDPKGKLKVLVESKQQPVPQPTVAQQASACFSPMLAGSIGAPIGSSLTSGSCRVPLPVSGGIAAAMMTGSLRAPLTGSNVANASYSPQGQGPLPVKTEHAKSWTPAPVPSQHASFVAPPEPVPSQIAPAAAGASPGAVAQRNPSRQVSMVAPAAQQQQYIQQQQWQNHQNQLQHHPHQQSGKSIEMTGSSWRNRSPGARHEAQSPATAPRTGVRSPRAGGPTGGSTTPYLPGGSLLLNQPGPRPHIRVNL
eukprot:TRINITY_DN61338_c0_g1_i1.p1 TRINITY_DN61338_c0_g1~~TRINITY_DN61338_c0_g1_i1.p1  ORF type:complete len:337 (+),score=43.18 TRINITY_DN61338_c0_g1_i1:29-1012(+)